MEFLKRAEAYSAARGDDACFRHYYTLYRTHFSVGVSVRKTLEWLYDSHLADLLEYQ